MSASGARRAVWADSGSGDEPGLAIGSSRLWSPLYEVVLDVDPPAVAKWARHQLGRPDADVEVGGTLSDPRVAYRAYMLWLWGRAIIADASLAPQPEFVREHLMFALRRPEAGFRRAAALFASAVTRARR